MTKEQQEKGIKELALDMASYGYSSEAWGAANVKDKNKIAHRKLFLAEYLVKKGWRKAGDTISQDSIKAMKKAEAIQFGRIIPIISKGYAIWKNKVIELIANDTRINAVVKLEEIKCVLRNDGHYPESYQNGEYPEDAWQAEIQAIGDSQ